MPRKPDSLQATSAGNLRTYEAFLYFTMYFFVIVYLHVGYVQRLSHTWNVFINYRMSILMKHEAEPNRQFCSSWSMIKHGSPVSGYRRARLYVFFIFLSDVETTSAPVTAMQRLTRAHSIISPKVENCWSKATQSSVHLSYQKFNAVSPPWASWIIND